MTIRGRHVSIDIEKPTQGGWLGARTSLTKWHRSLLGSSQWGVAQTADILSYQIVVDQMI
jgi:hypothetical protein